MPPRFRQGEFGNAKVLKLERSKSHSGVEYVVEDAAGREKIFFKFDEAAAFAVQIAIAKGEATLDVLVHSVAGARFVMGDEGVEMYRDDPEASVFQRFEISVNNVGRVP